MIGPGSRYSDLPQTTNVTATGEQLLGVTVRFIPRVAASFVHTVQQGERLDLLAFKYYGDASRWWQIADANPAEAAYPPALLDARPIVDEIIETTCPGLNTRLLGLIGTLAGHGAASRRMIGPNGERIETAGAVLEVSYGAAGDRATLIANIRAAGFSVLKSIAWPGGEAFTIVDPALEGAWSTLLATLRKAPGVAAVRSEVPLVRLAIRYNGNLMPGDEIRRHIAAAGFAVIPSRSVRLDRPGTQIVIPPNQEG
jgi:phage tail protein X